MSENQPDETLQIGPDKVTLQLGSTVVDTSPADRMIVTHYTGEIEEVVIFPFSGRRKVVRIVEEIRLSSTTPAVETSASYPKSY